jgi:hypothetical protein
MDEQPYRDIRSGSAIRLSPSEGIVSAVSFPVEESQSSFAAHPGLRTLARCRALDALRPACLHRVKVSSRIMLVLHPACAGRKVFFSLPEGPWSCLLATGIFLPFYFLFLPAG